MGAYRRRKERETEEEDVIHGVTCLGTTRNSPAVRSGVKVAVGLGYKRGDGG